MALEQELDPDPGPGLAPAPAPHQARPPHLPAPAQDPRRVHMSGHTQALGPGQARAGEEAVAVVVVAEAEEGAAAMATAMVMVRVMVREVVIKMILISEIIKKI